MKDYYKINLGYSHILWTFKLKEEQIKDSFGLEKVFFPEQIHGNNIILFERDKNNKCDGVFTREKNVFLGVKTADCVPLILSHKEIIGALHCGWRGLAGGILESLKNFIENEGFSLKEFFFFIGPSIGPCCYEVKEDVGNLFPDFFKDGKVDLKGIILNFLIKNGVKVKNIKVEYTCTFCNKSLPSHRREKSKGRILTGIYREK